MNEGGLDEKIPVAVLILPLILAFQPYLLSGNIKADEPRNKPVPRPVVDPQLFSASEYGLIGPFRGGRAPAVMLSQSLKRELNYQN